MTPKEQFLSEPHSPDHLSNADRLRMLIEEPWFQQVLIFTRAQLLSSGVSGEEFVAGALRYESTLLNLAIEAPDVEDIPQAQLRHDIDSAIRNKTPTPTKT